MTRPSASSSTTSAADRDALFIGAVPIGVVEERLDPGGLLGHRCILGADPRAGPATPRSHSRTACVTASRSFLSPWSPGTITTSRDGPGGGIPERITLALHDKSRHAHRIRAHPGGSAAACLRVAVARVEKQGRARLRRPSARRCDRQLDRPSSGRPQRSAGRPGRLQKVDRRPRSTLRRALVGAVERVDPRHDRAVRSTQRRCRRRGRLVSLAVRSGSGDAATGTVTEDESTTWLVNGARTWRARGLGRSRSRRSKRTAFVSSERPGQDRRG